MEAHVPQDDALARIVSLADAEGLLRAGSLERFVDGLRERGRIILEGRVLPLERRVEALEAENAWRRDSMAALEQRIVVLEQEKAEAAAAHDRLLGHQDAVLAAARREAEAREDDLRRLREEHAKAAAAHDRLLAHHEAALGKIAAELTAIVSWLPWSYRRARTRLSQLADTLRAPIP